MYWTDYWYNYLKWSRALEIIVRIKELFKAGEWDLLLTLRDCLQRIFLWLTATAEHIMSCLFWNPWIWYEYTNSEIEKFLIYNINIPHLKCFIYIYTSFLLLLQRACPMFRIYVMWAKRFTHPPWVPVLLSSGSRIAAVRPFWSKNVSAMWSGNMLSIWYQWWVVVFIKYHGWVSTRYFRVCCVQKSMLNTLTHPRLTMRC